MKTLVCLGAALFVAALSLPAADAKQETAEQRTARHNAELLEATARVNALVQEFPLLTGPGWEENYGKFRAELVKIQAAPEFKTNAPPAPRFVFGKPPVRPTLAQLQQERRDALLAVMRRQGDKVLEKYPELGAYVEQQLQRRKRLLELQDLWRDNPKVRQLVQNRLEVVAVPAAPQ